MEAKTGKNIVAVPVFDKISVIAVTVMHATATTAKSGILDKADNLRLITPDKPDFCDGKTNK